MNEYIWIYIYLIVINIVTFATYVADKWRAIHNKWRIRESVLLGLALAGGSFGALIGIYGARHKTKHRKFTVLVPLFFVIHVIFIILMKIIINY